MRFFGETVEAEARMRTKLCTACREVYPHLFFTKDRGSSDGLRYSCKACEKDYREDRRQRLLEHPEPEVEPPRKRVRLQDHYLYVAALSSNMTGEEHGLKIGRAVDVGARLRSLSKGLSVKVVELARFPSAGHLELALHRRFARHRVDDGDGREWFRVSYGEILTAIGEIQLT